MARAREWPNNCLEARNRTAEIATASSRQLKPILAGSRISEVEQVRVIGLVNSNLLQIARIMEAVGATTNPINEPI